MLAILSGGGGEGSWLTWLYEALRDTPIFTFFGFDQAHHPAFHSIGHAWFHAFGNAWGLAIVLAVIALIGTRAMKRYPTGLQNLLEMIAVAMRNFAVGIIGPHGAKFTPYIGTLFFFVLFMNLMSLLPGFLPPTTTLSTTLALGITTIVFVHAVAIREMGLGNHIKHLANWLPVRSNLWRVVQFVLLTPVLFASHTLGEFIKPFTLGFRLFANMFGKEQVVHSLIGQGWGQGLSFFPIFLIILCLALVVSIIQAFLFAALTSVYIGVFTTHEEEHHEEHSADGSHHGHLQEG